MRSAADVVATFVQEVRGPGLFVPECEARLAEFQTLAKAMPKYSLERAVAMACAGWLLLHRTYARTLRSTTSGNAPAAVQAFRL